MGFLKKLNPFDDDKQDKAEKAEKEARKAEEEAQEAAADAARAREDAQRAAQDATRAESGGTAVAEEVVVESSEGRVSGAGIYRQYTTKAGDKMEDIAAYFYGDPVHKQRLIDDNPALQTWDGRELPGGLTINVGEDPSRGDAVSTA